MGLEFQLRSMNGLAAISPDAGGVCMWCHGVSEQRESTHLM